MGQTIMKPILVMYATREGQTRRIAEYLAARLEERGFSAPVHDAAHLPAGFDLEEYSAGILSASVHVGKHEPEMIKFVKRHIGRLDRMPNAFISVSLSEAGAEDATAAPERRAQAAADAQRMIQTFIETTRWRPKITRPVAGGLMYRHYNPVIRFVMKRIARRAGGGTDTSRNYEYTDWEALDRIVDELLSAVRETQVETGDRRYEP